MTKTVQEVINFLWANYNKGGVDIDGLYGKQCVDLPKAVMQFCGESSWNKARGNAKDVIDSLVADGVATWQPTSQSRIRVVSGTGGLFDASYGHIWIEVDQTIFSQNPTQTREVGSYGSFNNKKIAYLKCIAADSSSPKPSTAIGKTGTVQATMFNVRDTPSLSGKVVATYGKGQKIYNLVYVRSADGYVWFTYVSATGVVRFVAAGRNTGKAEMDDFITF
ncbi:MAG: SH3 domain-containing protein [Streptococcaceae bacterium]|jgi:hypothetical protein|nr:SH3 domain-containing protein [Streptococcaceae bacterium]